MVWVRYQQNSRETRTYLRRDDTLAGAVQLAAHEAAQEAEMIIEAEAYETGALAASVHVEREDITGRFARLGYAVLADDPAAAPIQFGNKHLPESQVTEYLQEGARRAGLDVREISGDD